MPPESNFGEAWESLCHHLLCQEHGHNGFIKLNPPDRGIDIFHQPTRRAYQCKSNESGAAGTIDATESIKSLKTALNHRDAFDWHPYCFATNANYSGAGFEKLLLTASEINIDKTQIEHLGPEYWDSLCEKYHNTIKERFDLRIQVSEEQVIEAFKKAKYYDEYVSKYAEEINKAKNYTLVISNNRTASEIEIPFSPELSIENYLDVAKSLLGISLDWTNFDDLDTSAGPSVSVTIDRVPQPFSKKLKELSVSPGDKLEIWIKIVWKDQKKDGATSSIQMLHRFSYLETTTVFKKTVKSYQEKRQLTVDRKEEIIQSMIWNGVSNLVAPK